MDLRPDTRKEGQGEVALDETRDGSNNSEENSVTDLETSAQQQMPVRDQEEGPAGAVIQQPTTTRLVCIERQRTPLPQHRPLFANRLESEKHLTVWTYKDRSKRFGQG